MQIPYYVVDAFAGANFCGNPAGVCLLSQWIEDVTLQQIAAENNLSETAFLVQQAENEFALRWFTPKSEVNLCGHATLAAAFVVFEVLRAQQSTLLFDTKSGFLAVRRKEDLLELDFPSQPPLPVECWEELTQALGIVPLEVWLSDDLLVLLDNEREVFSLCPDFLALSALELGRGVVVTAPGDSADFVSRCFYPKLGINEDPVTGSAHCMLVPYWASQLEKDEFFAKQLSDRGGNLLCSLQGDRVKIAGKARLYLTGFLSLED